MIVDMGASPLGGNVAGSVAGETVVTPNGVTIIGAQNLAASVPTAASNAYSRNISALLLHLVSEGGADDRHHRRDPGGGRRRARGRGRAPRRRETARRRIDHEPRELAMSTALVTDLTIFVLALLVGIEVIGKVPATLHTPLMSAANSIHGIVLAGALLIGLTAHNVVGYVLAFVAAFFAAANVVGGYVVTGRMLKMFRRKARRPRPAAPAAVTPPAVTQPAAAPPAGAVNAVGAGSTAASNGHAAGSQAQPGTRS